MTQLSFGELWLLLWLLIWSISLGAYFWGRADGRHAERCKRLDDEEEE